MIKLKKGISLLGLTTQALLAITIVESVYKKHGNDLTITSVSDGKHSSTYSLHYSGNAFDCRIWGISSEDLIKIRDEIKSALGDDFVVLIEETHIHVAYKPKYK